MRMGLREANQYFTRAIKAVKAGHDVVLTERGKPIARISPLRVTADRAIARMVAEGRLSLGAPPEPIKHRRWRPIRIKGAPLSRTLRTDRDAR